MSLLCSVLGVLILCSPKVYAAAVVVTPAPASVVRAPVVTPPYYGYGYYRGNVNATKVYRGNNYYRNNNVYRGGAYHGTTTYRNGNAYHRSTYRR